MTSNEIIWFNGSIVPMSEARVSVEDRGFLFADGVYEAMRVYDGRTFALDAHLDRLERSAGGLKLPIPITRQELSNEIGKLVARTEIREGVIYLQLTRGPAKRNHLFPDPASVKPTLFFFVRPLPPIVPVHEQPGAKLHTVLDQRWRKCWIKSTALMANALARNEAADHGCDEAVFVDENNVVAECTSSNLFLVIDGTLVTHPVGERVLPGITRAFVIHCARQVGMTTAECPPHVVEARKAAEVFITSTTREIQWVREWDGAPAGGGSCGALTQRLHASLREAVQHHLATH